MRSQTSTLPTDQQNVFQISKLNQSLHLGARRGLRVTLGAFPIKNPAPSFHLVISPEPQPLDVKASLLKVEGENDYNLSYYVQNFSDNEFLVSVRKV